MTSIPLTLATYLVSAYLALPMTYLGALRLYAKRYDICPLVKCAIPLVRCLKEPLCRQWLGDVATCSDEGSKARQESAIAFSHVQHPHDAAFCRYQSFDRLETDTALDFLECIGRSGCMEPSTYTDTCVVNDLVALPLSTVPRSVLEGRWLKLATTGWDLWQCQWTDFWSPESQEIAPDDWMTEWPQNPRVWRMDLYWKNSPTGKVTFHMNNEMYPNETWNFTDMINKDSSGSSHGATLKTRAVMWGTEAHENWYLLDFQKEHETMIIYYCAYTEAVDRFDSMAMILQKEGAAILTDGERTTIEERGAHLLGGIHGRFQRIHSCGTVAS